MKKIKGDKPYIYISEMVYIYKPCDIYISKMVYIYKPCDIYIYHKEPPFVYLKQAKMVFSLFSPINSENSRTGWVVVPLGGGR
jgi:hypothetical protein